MRPEQKTSLLSTVFVDYDNIYLSLKRKNDAAAKAFAKDASRWIEAIVSGELITATNGPPIATERRIVMNRCYGNPVPRRNAQDNSTDMNSFPFVRHHFLRSGFEVIDCPPLTAQLKNSADIRMVMDVRDYLNHDTYFDEFVILSGDADFTPVLHRLRAHARRTVIFSNDHTAAPYKAISDGEVRESDLIALLARTANAGTGIESNASAATSARPALPGPGEMDEARQLILAEVVNTVRQVGQPVPLEALADRAIRQLGHVKTVGCAWAGAGSFRDLLTGHLPSGLAITEHPPFLVFDANRQVESPRSQVSAHSAAPVPSATKDAVPQSRPEPVARQVSPPARLETTPTRTLPAASNAQAPAVPAPGTNVPHAPAQQHPSHAAAAPQSARPQGASQPAAQPNQDVEGATKIQRSISRIQEACQAPALSPHAYGILFDQIAQEIAGNGLAGSQTITNIASRTRVSGVDISENDLRFVLEVISDNDPWFDQGVSANLFASRFRNFVIMRCRGQGLNLSADEIDLIEAWFMSGPAVQQSAATAAPQPQPQPAQHQQSAATSQAAHAPSAHQTTAQAGGGFAAPNPLDAHGDSLPRFVRGR